MIPPGTFPAPRPDALARIRALLGGSGPPAGVAFPPPPGHVSPQSLELGGGEGFGFPERPIDPPQPAPSHDPRFTDPLMPAHRATTGINDPLDALRSFLANHLQHGGEGRFSSGIAPTHGLGNQLQHHQQEAYNQTIHDREQPSTGPSGPVRLPVGLPHLPREAGSPLAEFAAGLRGRDRQPSRSEFLRRFVGAL